VDSTALSRNGTVELRVDVDAEDMAVLDAYNMATGTSRKDVIVKLLRQWSDRKRHEATVIVNVTRVIPTLSETDRK
jgi:hypothetical protein